MDNKNIMNEPEIDIIDITSEEAGDPIDPDFSQDDIFNGEDNCPVCGKPDGECVCPRPPHRPPHMPPWMQYPIPTTPFYHLPQFGPKDLSDWFVNMNLAMMSIDAALHNMDLKVMRYPAKLEKQIRHLRDNIKELNGMVVNNSLDIDELKDKTDATNTIVEQIQSTIGTQQLQIDNLSTRVQTSELNVAAMNTKVANLDANVRRIIGEFALLKQDFDKLNVAFSELENANTEFNTRLTEVEDSVEVAVDDLNKFKASTKENFDTVNLTINQLTDDVAAVESENTKQAALIQNNSARIDTLGNNLNALETKHDSDILGLASDIVDLEREDTKIKEAATALTERVDTLSDKIDNVEAKNTELETNFNTLSDTMQNLVETEEGHDTRLTALETDVENLKTASDNADSSINELSDKITANTTAIGTLTDRADTVDTTIGTINDTISGINTTVTNIGGQLEDAIDSVDDHTTEIGTMKTSISTAQTDIAKLKEDVAALDPDQSAAAIETLNNDVSVNPNNSLLKNIMDSMSDKLQGGASTTKFDDEDIKVDVNRSIYTNSIRFDLDTSGGIVFKKAHSAGDILVKRIQINPIKSTLLIGTISLTTSKGGSDIRAIAEFVSSGSNYFLIIRFVGNTIANGTLIPNGYTAGTS